MKIINQFSSPNCSKRTHLIEYVILHYTEMNFDGAMERLCDSAAKVSAHYLIKEDGTIFQLVDDAGVAWHAGKSSWQEKEGLNEYSIGIELDNTGDKAFDSRQMVSCLRLCGMLKTKHTIKQENFIGHSDIAPSRKIDPGIFFDWQLMHKHGFGIWHDAHLQDSEILFKHQDKGDEISKIQKKLKFIGYNIVVNGVFDEQMNFVVRAFLSKFCPDKINIQNLQNNEYKYYWRKHHSALLDELVDNFMIK